jgi:hypothetical protein
LKVEKKIKDNPETPRPGRGKRRTRSYAERRRIGSGEEDAERRA